VDVDERKYRWPAVVLALGLIGLASVDAVSAINAYQSSDLTCSIFGQSMACGSGNQGWLTDLVAAALSMAVAVLLLLRPDRFVLASTGVWAAVAFAANLIGRKAHTVDPVVSYRCPVYFLVLVGAVVLFVIAQQTYMSAKTASDAKPPAAR
jgi:hypothetical protein